MKANKTKSGSHNTHARYSASGADTWVPCTKSVSFVEKLRAEGLVPQRSMAGDAARIGTLAHDYAQFLLETELDRDPKFMAMPDELVDDTLALRGYVDRCLDTVGENDVVIVEHKAYLFYLPTETGTSDWVTIHRNKKGKVKGLTVRDLKWGQGPYTMKLRSYNNRQLAIYSLSTIHDLVRDGDMKMDYNLPIIMELDKPRVSGDAGTWELTLGELVEFCDHIRESSDIIKADKETKFAPSTDACYFCNGRTHCPAKAATPLVFVPADMDMKPVSLEACVQLYLMIPQLKDVMKVATDRLMEHQESTGKAPEGTKLVPGATRRAYMSPEVAIDFFEDKGLSEDDYLKPPAPRALIPMGQMEKVFRGDDKKDFQDILTKNQSPPKLVADSDPRPDALTNLDELFDL